ncbi:MAG: hypothetical protein CSA95_06275 [Bacteroidetes bacterium]|nr:MAG: hypothetical protein CSA95_06275 [Bacteroidota bacterium]
MTINKISIVALVALLLILVGFVATSGSTKQAPPMRVTGVVDLSKDYYFTLQQLHEEVTREVPEVLFVDLRHPDKFDINHFKDAINIPLDRILEKEALAQINDADKPVVLVAENEQKAVQAWITLNYAGIEKTSILAGGYPFARKNILKNYHPKYNRYFEEKARYDYKKYFSSHNASTSRPSTVPKAKKTTAVEGGC